MATGLVCDGETEMVGVALSNALAAVEAAGLDESAKLAELEIEVVGVLVGVTESEMDDVPNIEDIADNAADLVGVADAEGETSGVVVGEVDSI